MQVRNIKYERAQETCIKQDGVVVLAWRQKKDNSTNKVETTNFEIFYKEVADNSTGATVFDSDQVFLSSLSINYK